MFIWRRSELNRQLHACKTCALPIELRPLWMDKMGFEPMIQYCCICQAGRALSCFSPRSEPHVLRFALTCDLRNLLTMLTRRSNGGHSLATRRCPMYDTMEVKFKKPSALRSVRHLYKLMLTCFAKMKISF